MTSLNQDKLMALEVGDWIWVKTNKSEKYMQIVDNTNEDALIVTGNKSLAYKEMGETWVSYKNKEEKEAKGWIMEIPTRTDFPVYGIVKKKGEYKVEKYWIKEIVLNKYNLFYARCEKVRKLLQFDVDIFADEEDAKAKLAEKQK